MLVIYQSLSFTNHDHVMFWAASTHACFGFLCSSKFTVSSLSAFNPLCQSATILWILTPHLPVFKLASRLPRPTLFGKVATSTLACVVHLSVLNLPSCSIYLYEASLLAPCFSCHLANLALALLTRWLKNIFAASGIQGSFSSHSLGIGAATVAAHTGTRDHLYSDHGALE